MNKVINLITSGKAIILFDGVCNFCNSSVNFIIDRDIHNKFLFASIQSDEGDFLIKKYRIDIIKNDSIILVEKNKFYLRTAAALRISKH